MLKTILVSLLLLGSLHAQQPGAGRGAGAVAQRTHTIDERTAGMQMLDGFFMLYWDVRTGNLWLVITIFASDFNDSSGLAAW